MNWYFLLDRLKEKSTWVAVGSFLTGLGVAVKPEHWQIIMTIGMGLPGLVTMFLPARITADNIKPPTDPK